jgi:hypothetical protein
MKVKMLVSIAGHAEPKYGLPEFAFKPGEVVELTDTLAKAWIAGWLAEAVEEKKAPEDKKKRGA